MSRWIGPSSRGEANVATWFSQPTPAQSDASTSEAYVSGASSSAPSQDATSTSEAEKVPNLSPAALQELNTLRRAGHVYQDALRRNKDVQDLLNRALVASDLDIKELQDLETSLDFATNLAEEGTKKRVVEQSNPPLLPLFDELDAEIPLLRKDCQDQMDLRDFVLSNPWSEAESLRLKEVTLKECQRATSRVLLSRYRDRVWSQVSSKSASDVVQVSLPAWARTHKTFLNTGRSGLREDVETDEEEDDGFDWEHVSNQMGLAKTPEECRTRWIMNDRPGISSDPWKDEEVMRLIGIVQRLQGAEEDWDWEQVAKELGTNRLGSECLMTYACNDANPANDSLDYTKEEDLRILQQAQIWSESSSLVAERSCPHRLPVNLSLHYAHKLRAAAKETLPVRWEDGSRHEIVLQCVKVQLEAYNSTVKGSNDLLGLSIPAAAVENLTGNRAIRQRIRNHYAALAEKLNWHEVARQVDGMSWKRCKRHWIAHFVEVGITQMCQDVEAQGDVYGPQREAKRKREEGQDDAPTPGMEGRPEVEPSVPVLQTDRPWAPQEDAMIHKYRPGKRSNAAIAKMMRTGRSGAEVAARWEVLKARARDASARQLESAPSDQTS
ncbi:hypothetical protein IE81DRAFT_346261 [Ceraceosorus guamensis]|uniref:Myb-like domain-containing protein n=1 Tax=Ceraceosorus guamensis TaxID=1522189 RepID=A0A316W875_9BASI|nr:hypothetical protein IE81DRAFT_346261 [Ceraceosorus guamensis]PWN43875.1 hypothetical protein IE81DRAFT_346261 [Ceraceosorus guamensis]